MNTKTINVLLGLFLFLFVAIFLQTKEGFIEGASDESSTPKPCSQWSHTEEDKNSKKKRKKKKETCKKRTRCEFIDTGGGPGTGICQETAKYMEEQSKINELMDTITSSNEEALEEDGITYDFPDFGCSSGMTINSEGGLSCSEIEFTDKQN